jgi:hypothetical protein
VNRTVVFSRAQQVARVSQINSHANAIWGVAELLRGDDKQSSTAAWWAPPSRAPRATRRPPTAVTRRRTCGGRSDRRDAWMELLERFIVGRRAEGRPQHRQAASGRAADGDLARYHQWDVVRRCVETVRAEGPGPQLSHPALRRFGQVQGNRVAGARPVDGARGDHKPISTRSSDHRPPRRDAILARAAVKLVLTAPVPEHLRRPSSPPRP